jgi:TetR/AcrR family transcriptional repressor of nem operon
MKKGERTRREIVRKAAPLFNAKGYEGTTLSDLMQATSLQKGGIYRHFSGKEELAGEAFDYAWARSVEERLVGVEESGNAVDRLKKMVANFVERRAGLVPGGCPLMNTAIEADDGNAVLRAKARKALRNWTERLRNVTAQGISAGEIDARVEPLRLAQMIIGSLEGALLISRLERSDEPLQNARQHLETYLEDKVRSNKVQ